MNNFCAITPDRQDRPQFLKHCIYQMLSQTMQPGEHIVINDPPKSNKPDLIERIRAGIEIAKKRGFSRAYIVENDDYYPDDYFEKMEAKRAEFAGLSLTTYYHLDGRYTTMPHGGRSSLFTTSFDIAALDGFRWPDPGRTDLDILLWEYATNSKKTIFLSNKEGDGSPIGIKHGVGLCGGSGHKSTFRYSFTDDIDRSFLRSAVRPYSFDFYMSLIRRD